MGIKSRRGLQRELRQLKNELRDAKQQLRQSRSDAQRAREEAREAREAEERARQDAVKAADAAPTPPSPASGEGAGWGPPQTQVTPAAASPPATASEVVEVSMPRGDQPLLPRMGACRSPSAD
jgi:hypothetical protein